MNDVIYGLQCYNNNLNHLYFNQFNLIFIVLHYITYYINDKDNIYIYDILRIPLTLFVSVQITRSIRVLSDSAADNGSEGVLAVLKGEKSQLRQHRSDVGQVMGQTYQPDWG